MMKNVSLLPLIVFSFSVNSLNSTTRLIQLVSSNRSSPTKQRLKRACQVTAQSLNPVNIINRHLHSFLMCFLDKITFFPPLRQQPIANEPRFQAQIPWTGQENHIYPISINASREVVFAKTISLNMTSLNLINVKNNHDQNSQLLIVN
jgi:hypothetical protein